MAITQVGSANTGPGDSNSTTLTLTKPSGVASGHLLVAVVTSIGSGSSITGPSSWTEVDTATSGGGMKMSLWAKIAGGSEGSNYSWNETSLGSQRFVGTISAWDGVDVTSLATAINTSTEHDVIGNTSTSTAQTTPTLSSSAYANGRVFYARSCRIATNTPITFTESSGSASEMADHGNDGNASGISYSHIVALADADFSGAGSKSGLSTTASSSPTDNVMATWVIQMEGIAADGDVSATTPSVTSSFAGTRTMADGPIASTTPSVSADMVGVAAPPDGPMVATTPSVAAALSGAHDHAGPVGATTPSITSALTGSVAPTGPIEATLPSLASQFGSETKPFGEHVIRVEAEERAFSVIDDDPGLKPILRSQVTEGASANVQAGCAEIAVAVYDATVSIPVNAPAGLVSATATAYAASAVSAFSSGSASVSATANNASVSISGNTNANAGAVAVSVTANNATVSTVSSTNAPAGLASVSASAKTAGVQTDVVNLEGAFVHAYGPSVLIG